MTEPLNRSTFPRAPEEVLLPTVETVELEPETDARGLGQRAPPRDSRLADALRQAHDPRPLLPELPELRTLPDEIPFIRRYLEQSTWRIWVDVVGLLTAALLLAHWALWGL
jgi:hypothetical protein